MEFPGVHPSYTIIILFQVPAPDNNLLYPTPDTVKPALGTTCSQRPPVFKDHLVMSQLKCYHASRDHLYSNTTFFFWPKGGRLILVSLYNYI